MDALGQCFAAKHVYEGIMFCVSCGAELVVGSPGWALEASPNVLQPAACTSCGASWNALDATPLVEVARALSASARAWVDAYRSITDQLRLRIGDRCTVRTDFGTFHGHERFVPSRGFVSSVTTRRALPRTPDPDLDVSPLVEVVAMELRTRGTAALGRAGVLRFLGDTLTFEVQRRH